MTRNKLKDMLVDYYVTNREITRQYKERYAEEKRQRQGKKAPWTYREKALIAAVILACIALAVRLYLQYF